jgi:hypothetical protein
MNQQDTFEIGQKIHGRMPIATIWATNPGAKDKIEPIGKIITFKGVVKRISEDEKVKTFQLTKPINSKTEATQKTREGEALPVEVGDIISVDDSPGWDIQLMPSD